MRASRLAVCVALAMACTSGWAKASPLTTLTAHAALGQLTAAQERAKRSQADEILREAKLAMNAGDYIRAEQLIGKAESLNVKYDALWERFRDTPAKLRRQLDAARRAPSPSSRFQPQTASNPAASSDTSNPFANRDRNQAINQMTAGIRPPTVGPTAAPSGTVDRVPSVGARTPSQTGLQAQDPPRSRFSSPPAKAPATPGPVQNPHALLLQARVALLQGNVAQAQQLATQAHKSGGVFPQGTDNPRQVMTLINTYHRTMAAGQGRVNKDDFARLLVDQAEGFMYHNDLVNAGRLARQAADMKVASTAGRPERLLTEIARRQGPRTNAPQPGARPGAAPNVASRPGTTPAGGSRFTSAPKAPATRATTPTNLPTVPAQSLANRKREAVSLVKQGQVALANGDLERAEKFALQAGELEVPLSAFAQNEIPPAVLLSQIDRRRRSGTSIARAGGTIENRNRFPVRRSDYNPSRDNSRNVAASAVNQPTPAVPAPQPLVPQSANEGERLYQRGQMLLIQGRTNEARQAFQDAWQYQAQLDPQIRQDLMHKLQGLRSEVVAPGPAAPSPLQMLNGDQRDRLSQMYAEVQRELSAAERMRQSEPRAALDRLNSLRQRIAQSELPPAQRTQFLKRVDRVLNAQERYIEDHKATIAREERNTDVRGQIARDRQHKLEVDQQLADLVEEFNTLLREQRWGEADAIARQAMALDPRNPVVKQIEWQNKFVRRIMTQQAIDGEKENNVILAFNDVDRASTPFDTSDPIRFPERALWQDLTARRSERLRRENSQMTESELQIRSALQKKVDVNFTNMPLSEVISTLGAQAGVPVYLDPTGLELEGQASNTPVSIRISKPIMLRSALNHILGPLRLNYVVRDEVLKITSQQSIGTETFTRVYNVADLVIPIPNFIPSANIGLPGALRAAHETLGYGNRFTGGSFNQVPMALVAGDETLQSAPNASVLAQLGGGALAGGRSPQSIGFGPGGVSGGAQADFDSIIELITTTIDPTTWDEVGGPGSVKGFDTNLSLVVSQTQEVHEQIVDLLEQLRRLQDLQVTIEVRFITLSDSFFERIGVDFDFDIDDNVTVGAPNDDGGPSLTIGLDSEGNATPDLDISFTQGGFGASLPAFGGFDAGTAANFGFAILSDIEAFFIIQAAQGDTRSNVMQAPKVTLFNGQQAFVSDTSQTPFVTSVIPVVGDFAAAQQPVIVVLTEGTSLSVQAVVSPDRRFVRLTVVPFFSQIDSVQEFTFDSKTTVDTGSSTDVNGDGIESRDNEVTTTEGTTVQLPTFSFVTVTTTVSVPDGGTVLLGGIKRLSEGRTERGVPILSKMPYISRLFRNVGIGRDTSTLMLMVTPRIIIQEEEEELRGINQP